MSGGIVTGSFIFSAEVGYRVVYESSYLNMLANMWWTDVTKVFNTNTKTAIFEWLIQTAGIDQLTPADGGEDPGPTLYEELSTASISMSPARFGKALKISKMKWLNLLAKGLDPVGEWFQQSGTYAAYRPQRSVAETILANPVCQYDKLPFFSKSHLNNPNIPGNGTYANDFTGAASGTYPGALPIDDSVSVDVALTNLTRALAYVSGAVNQPNGQDCRMLEPAFLIHPPRMTARVQQLTNTRDVTSNIIAQLAGSAGTAGGSGDVGAIIKNYNLTEPVLAHELDANRKFTFGPPNMEQTVFGNDKCWYLVTKEAGKSQIGAFLLNNRAPFVMHTYSGESGSTGIESVLGRSEELEWLHVGYYAVAPGLPYTIFRFQGS